MHCSLSRRSLHASSQTHQVDSSTLSCLCFICPFACLKQSFASYISYNYRRNEKEMAANSVFHTLCIYLYFIGEPLFQLQCMLPPPQCIRRHHYFTGDRQPPWHCTRERAWLTMSWQSKSTQWILWYTFTYSLIVWWLTVVHLPLPACLSQLMQYKL